MGDDAMMMDALAPGLAPGLSWNCSQTHQQAAPDASAGAVVAVPLPVRGTAALQRLQAAMLGCSTADVLLHAVATLTRRLLPAEVDSLGLTDLGVTTGEEENVWCWRGVLKHVSREMRLSVTKLERRRGQPSAMRLVDVASNLHIFEWARMQGCPWDERTCWAAASAGNLQVLQVRKAHGLPLGRQHLHRGRAPRQRWRCSPLARASACPWDEDTCETAAWGGHLHVLQWARSMGCLWDERTCSGASGGGHLGVLQWARANGCPWEERTCARAAGGGHLSNGCPWDRHTCAGAAEGGHLEVFKWVRDQGCAWSEDTCRAAAEGGQLEVLQWAKQQGCPWDSWTCVGAAARGHLRVLQWAKQQGCPWDEGTCEAAVSGGHLDVLVWARMNGCPWDDETTREAAESGQLECLKWAVENGCPWDKMQCIDVAFANDHHAVCQWAVIQEP
eukprot:jgi/Tetstr1/459983/TSEL_005307.t1